MIPAARIAGVFTACAILAACASTGGRATYEAPLRQAGLQPPVAEKKDTPELPIDLDSDAPITQSVVTSDDSIRVDGIDYSFTDLSPGERPANDTDEAGLWMVMDRVEREAGTAGNRVLDEKLNNYVSEVTCRIAGEYCDDIRVYLIRRPAFNASMAPNGMMSVWTGLLLRVRNEAQLATVLGHEIGHFLRRHSLQRMRDVIAKTNGLIFFQIAVGAAGVAPVGDIAALGVLGSIQAYGRDNEREADGYGLLFLHHAGYDPREASKIWSQLLRERDADPDKTARSVFFASHPPSVERRDVLADLGKALQAQSQTTETGKERYVAETSRFRTDWLRDEIHLRTFETTDAMLDDLLTDDANPAELYFFKGELRRVRNEEGDDEAALEFYDKALAAAGTPPANLHRSRGVVLLRSGDNADAARAFQQYLDAVPEAEDRLIIEDMIGRLSLS